MYINKIGMLTAIDWSIKFWSLISIKTTSQEDYYKAINMIVQKYNDTGFKIKCIYCDGEFKPLMDKVKDELGIEMNYTNV